MTDLLEDVRHAARAIGGVVDPASEAWPRVSAVLSAILDDVERRLSSKDLTVVVLGTHADARLLIDTAVGEVLLPGDRPGAGVRLVIRHGAASRYLVSLADGTSLDSATALPDRTPFLDEALADAERDAERLEAEVAELRRQRDLRQAEVTPSVQAAPLVDPGTARDPGDDGTARGAGAWLELAARKLFAALLALVALVARLASHQRPPSALSIAASPGAGSRQADPAFERALAEREAELERARRAPERLRTARAEHVAARRRSFLDELASLTRPGALDRAVVELVIEYPCALLPPGLVLVRESPPAPGEDGAMERAPSRKRQRDLGGCIALAPAPGLDAALADAERGVIVPHVVLGVAPDASEAEAHLTTDRLRAALPSIFQRIRLESPTVVAALAACDVRDRLASLVAGSAKAETSSRAHLSQLEQSRVPAPAVFAQERMASMGLIIGEAVRRAVARAKETLRARLTALHDEWSRAIHGCPGRAALEAHLAAMGAEVPGRLASMLEQIMEEVAAEMNRTSETLQVWILDEMTVKYGTLGSEDDATPLMLSERSGGAGPVSGAVALASTREAFERKRVGIGLGGAAAGAALGTLILPGVGTAIGAFVGVLAGFVEGTEALKRRSVEGLREHLGAVEGELSAWIEEGRVSLDEDLRAAIQDTLDGALLRREATIRSLLDRQGEAIERERTQLLELSRVRAALEAQGAHFATLAGAAASAVRHRAAVRRAQDGAEATLIGP